MLKKVESDKLPKLRDMFIQASRGKEYNLSCFENCYCRYFGCGNHLYILVNDCDEDKIIEIGSQRIHPSEMARQIFAFVKQFRIVMLDVEIGDMSVWPPNVEEIL